MQKQFSLILLYVLFILCIIVILYFCLNIKPISNSKYFLFIEISQEINLADKNNNNLFESDFLQAIKIKRKLIKMLNHGNKKREILTNMKIRYKNFILFKPYLKNNVFIWFEPYLFILSSIFFIKNKKIFKGHFFKL